jgi:hypothetical protein
MKIKVSLVEPHMLTFSNGRFLYSYEGRMSMGPDMVAGLHSGIIQPSLDPNFVEFTPAERRAIRDYQVNLWQRWAKQ